MNLPDALLEQVKRHAAESGRTVTSVMEEALRQLLAQTTTTHDATRLPTYGTVGARPLVDLTDRDALWAVLDQPPVAQTSVDQP